MAPLDPKHKPCCLIRSTSQWRERARERERENGGKRERESERVRERERWIYIYIYGTPPLHELPTLVLYRKYRVKTAFPAGPDSVSLKNYRKQTQISRERVSQLIHVRREVRILYLSRTTEINLTFQQDMSVNSLRFDVSTKSTAALYPPNPKPTLPRENQKNQKKHLFRHYAAKLQKDGFLVFPRKKMVLDRKTNFFLGKTWFWTGKPTFS